ncbi:MAG: very short patch repair endonuclease [Isosphaeraceae bacterium]
MERKLRGKLISGQFQGLTPVNSKRMSAIRSRANKTTEVRLRLMLVRARVRGWRVHPPGVAGKPDFYFPSSRLALFIDGCFWHGCPLCGHVPRSNRPYWAAKIEGNRRRDRAYDEKLREEGVRVLRFWEHQLLSEPERVILEIREAAGLGCTPAPPRSE